MIMSRRKDATKDTMKTSILLFLLLETGCSIAFPVNQVLRPNKRSVALRETKVSKTTRRRIVLSPEK
jgi:hypothetical protein